LSIACCDSSIFPTLIREPAHPLPKAIEIATKYPAFSIQLEGAAAFTLIYLEGKERVISDNTISIIEKSADRLVTLSHPE
jgi:hypothetical protein